MCSSALERRQSFACAYLKRRTRRPTLCVEPAAPGQFPAGEAYGRTPRAAEWLPSKRNSVPDGCTRSRMQLRSVRRRSRNAKSALRNPRSAARCRSERPPRKPKPIQRLPWQATNSQLRGMTPILTLSCRTGRSLWGRRKVRRVPVEVVARIGCRITRVTLKLSSVKGCRCDAPPRAEFRDIDLFVGLASQIRRHCHWDLHI